MFGDAFRNKRVLITGHTGFKGSWLVTWLDSMEAHLCGVSKDIPTSPSLFEQAGLAGRIDHRICDVRDLSRLIEIIREFRPDFVFHLAAQAVVSRSYSDPIETISTNVMGTANVLEALRVVAKPCVAVIVTSDKCYDNVEWLWGYRESDALGGKDVYSGSKGAAELVFKSYVHSFAGHFEKNGIRVASARAGNVIGGGDWAADRIVADCIRAWSSEKVVPIRSPGATRPWQHVLEPLSGYLRLAQSLAEGVDLVGESFNFGPRAEQNRTVLEMLGDLGHVWGLKSPNEAYEVIDNIPFHEAGLLRLNCDKALIRLGWTSTLPYELCMSMTGLWYRKVLRDKAEVFEITLGQITEYMAEACRGDQSWTKVG